LLAKTNLTIAQKRQKLIKKKKNTFSAPQSITTEQHINACKISLFVANQPHTKKRTIFGVKTIALDMRNLGVTEKTVSAL
jgi:hypothetical protein